MANPKSALPSLIADTPEEEELVKNLKGAQEYLRGALTQRQQLFDPVLLAMAQGFLAPTKTGSFGESISNVAGRVLPVQEEQQKQDIQLAQMRAELASQELGQAQQTRRQREAQNIMRGLVGAPGGAPAGAAPAAGAPAGAAPTGATPVGVAPSAPSGPSAAAGAELRPLMESDIAAMYEYDPERAKILESLMKTQRDRFAISMQGIVFDKITGKYLDLPIPGQKQEDFSTPYGTFKMTPWQYSQFEKAEAEGKGAEWIDKFRRPGGMAATAAGAAGTASAAGAGAAPSGRLTVEQQEARQRQLTEEAAATGKSRAAQTTEVRDAGKSALTLLPIYDRAEILVKKPGMDQVLGVLERGDVLAQLGSLAEEAVRFGTFNVGIPAVRKILANAGTPQDLIDNAAVLGQIVAMIQFNQRKGLGSGTSVSNFEQMMVNAMGPDIRDTVRSFSQKLAFMKEKARFESDLAKGLRRSKMQYEDFEDTAEFKKLFDEYRARVTNIVYPGQRPFTVQR